MCISVNIKRIVAKIFKRKVKKQKVWVCLCVSMCPFVYMCVIYRNVYLLAVGVRIKMKNLAFSLLKTLFC